MRQSAVSLPEGTAHVVRLLDLRVVAFIPHNEV
jgi:hypothetical protein